jgi:uncharacterized protein YciI
MFRILFFISCLFFSMTCLSQNKNFDSALARKTGADEYGMKQYVVAFLKAGTTKITDTAQKAKLMKAHLQNIGRMAKEGSLVLAGPFLDNGNLAGIYIFNVSSVEEARKLTSTDPAVKAGVFEMELHPWYGSAALMQVTPIHYTLQKTSITD